MYFYVVIYRLSKKWRISVNIFCYSQKDDSFDVQFRSVYIFAIEAYIFLPKSLNSSGLIVETTFCKVLSDHSIKSINIISDFDDCYNTDRNNVTKYIYVYIEIKCRNKMSR